jgi:hypothetical protein
VELITFVFRLVLEMETIESPNICFFEPYLMMFWQRIWESLQLNTGLLIFGEGGYTVG